MKDVIALMEGYTSAVAGLYLISKAWKKAEGCGSPPGHSSEGPLGQAPEKVRGSQAVPEAGREPDEEGGSNTNTLWRVKQRSMAA